MSATSPALALVAPQPTGAGEDRLAMLRTLLRPEFLAEAGWDAHREVFAPPREHRLLGLRKCAVVDCQAGVRTPNGDFCALCIVKFKASGLPREQFAAIPAGRIGRGERWCRLATCPRSASLRSGLCREHHRQWRESTLPIEQFLALPDRAPLASFGHCRVLACDRAATIRFGLCDPHRQRWRAAERDNRDLAFEVWACMVDPINPDHLVSFKGLAEQAQLELLIGLQQRTDHGVRTLVSSLRAVVSALRTSGATSLDELDFSLIKSGRHDALVLARDLRTRVRRCLASPDTERVKDTWDLAVFGLAGYLRFGEISQPWLREAAKRWAEDDLPKHRGRQAANTAKHMVATLVHLSTSLRHSRDDHGDDPTALSHRDILTFTNRLAALQRTSVISEFVRLSAARCARRFLLDIRALRLTIPGGPAAGLPDDFLLHRDNIPPPRDPDRSGRDLPTWVLNIINDNLPVLGARSGTDNRRMVELMIDTGRRPDEICRLAFDCLARDNDGKPVLIYTDSKKHKPDQRLPIAEATASLITDQQTQTRQRFPDTSINELVLFPRDLTNPRGTEPNTEAVFTHAHRQFINAIADKLTTTVIGPDGKQRTEVFDRLAVVPYAYRHSFAQRHADEGVPPDVLRDLMGHDSIQTTVGYYRVTEKRVRAAVDRVSAHQFDGQGRRVFHRIQGLLAHEHARMRVGQVAVPFGICTEPSNVKAGGQACPYKFTCVGCGHFRSDPSYLPELKSYLQQLLADRERIQAATDLQDWARQQLTPRDEEIHQLRQLIRRVEDDVAELSGTDQAQIAEAVSVIRRTRQVVNLGLPSTKPPEQELG